MNLHKKKEVLAQYNIDPYKYLNVSLDCPKDQLDEIYKTRITETDSINEIKLLKECYKIILSDIQTTQTQAQTRNYQQSDFNRPRDFHRTDFTDSRNRQALFVNDTLNFEEFQRNLSKTTSKSTTYSPNSEPVERLFVNQKFDLKQFNEHFENKYAMEDTVEGSITPLDGSTSMGYMPICTYNGLIIEDQEQQTLSFDKPVLGTGRKRQAFKEESVEKLFAQKAGEQISVNTARTFKEAEKILEQEHLDKMKQQLEYNKNKVLKHLSIYPENIVNDFKSNRLDDSSTCVEDNRLTTPKGIRRID